MGERITFRVIVFALAILAAALFGAFILLGAWIDGRRQALRNKGLHPVTTSGGQVEAQEFAVKESNAEELQAREQQHGTSSRGQ